ncbi:MAG: glycosyltransferase family 39 protein [Bacteroidota bacterium]|jgi:Dolichyl-phosphate-mannose-protein mannosyltransferase
MNILRKYPYEILTIAGILVFIAFKISAMLLPFHGDEMGVYAPAAFIMKDLGHIGLLPSCLEPLYSRGHPLLLTFTNAIVFKLFGESVITGHSFAMCISVLTLVLFFLFARKEFNPQTAFFSTVILMAQPVFFTYSVMIFPEMMLTLFSVLSVWAIVRKKWTLYAISGSLALLTKESAVVIPLVAIVVIFIQAVSERDFFSARRIRLFLIGLIPLLVFGIFLVIQKIQNGWFLFPEHIGYIHFGWSAIYPIGKRILNEMFFGFGKWVTGASFLAGIVLCIFRKKLKLPLNSNALFTFALFCLFVFLFADFNYYLTRYILYGIPFIVLGGVHTLVAVSERIIPRFRSVRLMLLTVVTGLSIFFSHYGTYKYPFGEMSYTCVVKVIAEAVSWTEQQSWRNDSITSNFPVYQALSDKRNGYLKGEAIPTTGEFETKIKYGLVYYEWETKNILNSKNYRYKILKTWTDGFANVACIEFDHDSVTMKKE